MRMSHLTSALALATGCAQVVPHPASPSDCTGKFCIGWSADGVAPAVVICAGSQSQLDQTVQTLRATFPRSVMVPTSQVPQ